MRPLLLVLTVLVALVASARGVPAPAAHDSGETPTLRCGSLQHASDDGVLQGARTPVVAATPHAGRLPAVSGGAAARFRVEAQRFSRELGRTIPPARRAPSITWRHHVPRMDSGEPPGSGIFAT